MAAEHHELHEHELRDPRIRGVYLVLDFRRMSLAQYAKRRGHRRSHSRHLARSNRFLYRPWDQASRKAMDFSGTLYSLSANSKRANIYNRGQHPYIDLWGTTTYESSSSIPLSQLGAMNSFAVLFTTNLSNIPPNLKRGKRKQTQICDTRRRQKRGTHTLIPRKMLVTHSHGAILGEITLRCHTVGVQDFVPIA